MSAWLLSGNNLITDWADSIIRTVWQGSIVFALVWIALLIFPKIQPAIRCWLWRIVYVKLLVSLAGVLPFQIPWLSSSMLQSPVTRYLNYYPVSQWVTAGQYAPNVVPTNLMVLLTPKFWFILWLLGIGCVGMGLLYLWYRHRITDMDCSPVSDRTLVNLYLNFCAQLKIKNPPRLFQSGMVGSPSLQGLIHPRIILPAAVVSHYPLPEIKIILAHELAHFKRKDLWWNWLPIIARGLFFFHPLVWIAERQWQEAHEIYCDHLAVQFSEAAAADYGQVLLKAAFGSRFNLKTGLAPANEFYTPETKQILKERLIALGSSSQVKSKRIWITISALIVFGLAAITPWQLTLAGSPFFVFVRYNEYSHLANYFPKRNLTIEGYFHQPENIYIKNYDITVDNRKITGNYQPNYRAQYSAGSFGGLMLINYPFDFRKDHLLKLSVNTNVGNFQIKSSFNVEYLGSVIIPPDKSLPENKAL